VRSARHRHELFGRGDLFLGMNASNTGDGKVDHYDVAWDGRRCVFVRGKASPWLCSSAVKFQFFAGRPCALAWRWCGPDGGPISGDRQPRLAARAAALGAITDVCRISEKITVKL
jgi:hypothetical protein